MNFIRNVFLLFIIAPFAAIAQDTISHDSTAEQEKPTDFQARIAVVDIESIFEHSLAIDSIKRSIDNISKYIQDELSVKEAELKKIESDLVNQREKLNPEEFKKQLFNFNQMVSSTQQEMQKKKIALEQAHASSLAEVQKNVSVIIRELSKKHNFNIVFPSAQALYIDNNLNITSEVVSILNERLKSVEINYKHTTRKPSK